MKQHRRNRRKLAENVGNRHRKPDCKRLVVKEVRKEPDDRQKDDALAKKRESDCNCRLSNRLEVRRRDDVDRNRPDHAVRELQVAGSKTNYIGVVTRDEQSRNKRRERRYHLNDESEDGQRRSDKKPLLEGLKNATEIPRTPVVAEDRLKPLLAAEHWHYDEYKRAVEDSERSHLGSARRFVGHPLRKRNLERGDDHRAHEVLKERRKPYCESAAEKSRIYPDAAYPKTHDARSAKIVGKRPDARKQHRDVCRPRSADNSKAKTKDEYRVEDHIRAEADDHAHHRADRATLCAMQRRETECKMGEEMREEDDLQIRLRRGRRTRRHLVRTAKREYLVEKDVEKRDENGVEQDLERDCLAYELLACHAVAFSELNREDRRMSNAN